MIDEKLDDIEKPKEKMTFKKVLNKIVDGIVGCMIPLLPILIGSGLLQAIVLIAEQLGVSSESPTLVTLTFVANAAFYFLPVYLGGFAAKKFGGNTALGMMLGACLIHPTFVSMVSEGSGGSIFGIPIYAASYSSTVVPAILSIWVMCYVEKFISKHTPKSLRTILKPLLTLLIMVPVTFCFLAPLGAMLSDGFASAINWFYDTCGFIAVAVFAAIVPWVVMVGMHIGTVPIAIASIAANGKDMMMLPSFFLANFGQGAACLAVGVKTKNAKLKSLAFSSAFSDFVPGISEPGMYGITLRYRTPMWGAMIGSAAGGLYFGLTKVGVYSFMAPNLFQFAAYVDKGTNLLNAVIGVVITIVVGFIATMLLYKPEKEVQE
jgi:PTS system beta-glucosides-specific IIC component